MSGYQELRDLGVVFRPFDGDPPAEAGTWSRFDVELGLEDRDLRVDGLPRANARMTTDAVRVSFESKWGPLRYETGEFAGSSWRGVAGWQANVRAIALAMEALRKVDWYGVSKRGEQYRGWRALMPSSDPADQITTRDQAVALIHRHVDDLYDAEDVAGAHQTDAVREAIRRTHPDRGGAADDFRRVMRAKELLA